VTIKKKPKANINKKKTLSSARMAPKKIDENMYAKTAKSRPK